MKMKLLTSLVAAMAIGTICAFADNPFVNVPSDSWQYKGVVQLANAGIINGVDGSYFKNGRQITRYEAAEMTANAMTHMDQATLGQRAVIRKLTGEYADELKGMGVRVSDLENKAGNVKVSGDTRLMYQHQGGAASDQWQNRTRVRANVSLDGNTTVVCGGNVNTNQHSA